MQDFSSSSEQFYGKARKMGNKKNYPYMQFLIPSLLNLKKALKMLTSRKNNQKTLKQKRKKPNWWFK